MDNNLALLIDFENIAAGTDKEGLGRFDITAITQRLADKGRVLIARSYADWGRFSRFKQALLAANVTMYELTSHGMQDKNRADIAMVVDALELAFTKDYIDTFVVVSGDSDFTPLVLKMRELDKRVIGIGTRSSTSRLLVNACDEFIFYDTLVKSKKRKRTRSTSKSGGGRQRAYDLLVDALAGLQREDPTAQLASVVKRNIRRKSPDFSETELGFSSFARFLEAARDAGYVSLEKDRKAGGYRVDSTDGPTDDDPETEDDVDVAAAGPWKDPFLTDKVSVWVDALAEQGLNPLSYPTRMQVLQEIAAVAQERNKKRRKCNVQFVREDVRKRLRKTVPDIPARLIRGVFTALMGAELLIHKDGTAIRSAKAPFRLEKDAEGLNKEMLAHYLAALEEADADLHDVDGLAELFLGDAKRRREVEESLAWLAQSQMGVGDEAALNEIDLDDLLVAEPGAKKAEPKKAEAKKAEPKKPEAKKAEPEKADEAEKAETKGSEESDDDEAKTETASKPKRRSRAKKKPEPKADETEEGDTETAEDASDTEEEAPKKRTTRRRVRKKKTDDAKDEGSSDGNDMDLDALLSSD